VFDLVGLFCPSSRFASGYPGFRDYAEKFKHADPVTDFS
jgi:hypothetical protein